MNKYEVIGMFTALDELMEAKAYSGVRKVVKETLAAAKGEKPSENKGETQSQQEEKN